MLNRWSFGGKDVVFGALLDDNAVSDEIGIRLEEFSCNVVVVGSCDTDVDGIEFACADNNDDMEGVAIGADEDDDVEEIAIGAFDVDEDDELEEVGIDDIGVDEAFTCEADDADVEVEVGGGFAETFLKGDAEDDRKGDPEEDEVLDG